MLNRLSKGIKTKNCHYLSRNVFVPVLNLQSVLQGWLWATESELVDQAWLPVPPPQATKNRIFVWSETCVGIVLLLYHCTTLYHTVQPVEHSDGTAYLPHCCCTLHMQISLIQHNGQGFNKHSFREMVEIL